MDIKDYVSAYTIAKICGYAGAFDDFKKLYDQYYSEIINSLPEPDLDKVEAIPNPFRMQR